MATYTAAHAQILLHPVARGFHQKARRMVGGVDAPVKLVPNWSRLAAPQMAPIPVNVRPNLDQSALAGIEAALRALPKIELDANSTPAQQKVQELRARLEALRDKVINLQVNDQQARMEIALVKGELDRLDNSTATMDVRVDAAAASAALARVDADRRALDGKNARFGVDVDIGRAIAGLVTLATLVSGLDGKTIQMRTVLDTVGAVAGLAMTAAKVTALVGAIGALIGAAGGAIGALGGLGAAGAVAAAGLGPMILAFLGVGKALGAMSAAQESAGTDAAASAQKQEAAARQVESAQRRVAQASQQASLARSDAAKSVARAEQDSARQVASAQQSAGRAIASASKQAAAAHRQLRQATADLAREQRALTSAWEQGRRALQDLQDQVDGNALDQRQAAFDLEDAQEALNAARAGGDAKEIARAQLAYDRQLETIDQLNKQTERLGVDNRKAQAAGVAGSDAVVSANDRIRAAQDRVTQSQLAARDADAAVTQARVDGAMAVTRAQQDGAQRVADAREQGARSMAAADLQVVEAQRALSEALRATGDTGAAAVDKVGQAFAKLSPAAAAFARYLFGLKPVLEGLSATAATAFFPPLMRGMDLLLTKLPLIDRVVGQLAGGMGRGLEVVLANLANPFWMGFFSMLGDASGSVLPALFQTLMNVAGALAVLITHLMPVVPAALGAFDAFAQWIVILSPFIAQAFGGLIPAFTALLQGLLPLGPVLVALTPILIAITNAFSTVLGAVLQALVPVLVALTPLIQQLAASFATQLVSAIVALTPLLVSVATWMSENPQLVLFLVGALAGLVTTFSLIKAAVMMALGPLVLMRLATMVLGISATTVGAAVGGVFGRIAAALGGLAARFSILSLASSLMTFLAGAATKVAAGIGAFARAILVAIGPVGWLLAILGTLFVTNTQFRDAVMQVVGALGSLVSEVVSALMPAFTALTPVLTIVGQVVGALVTGLATFLVPIIQTLAQWIQFITPVLAPMVAIFLGIVGAVKLWTAAQWLLNTALAMNPIGLVVLAVAALIGACVWAYQNLGWFREAVDAVGQVFVWLWQTILQPVVDFFVNVFNTAVRWVIDNWSWLSTVLGLIAGPVGWVILAFTNFRDQTLAVFGAIGDFISWVWTNVIKPPLDLFGWMFSKVLGPMLQWFWVLVVQPILNSIGAKFTQLYNDYVKPMVDGIVWAWQTYMAPLLQAAYDNIIKPLLDATGDRFNTMRAVVSDVCRVVGDTWNWLVGLIRDAYNTYLKPILDGVKSGFESFKTAVDWITNTNPVPPPPGRAAGGLVVPVGYAAGGWVGGAPSIPGYARGGSSRARPKPGRSDTVPSLLTPGEFVFTRGATRTAGAKTMYALQALLERSPGAGRALSELIATIGGSRAQQPGPSTGMGSAGLPGYARGGAVAARRRPGELPAAGAGPAGGGATATVGADGSAAAGAAASTSAMASSMQTALSAAAALNPALAGLAATQTGLLAPAQAAVTLGQQAMATAVTEVLTPALGVYQQQIGVAAPAANLALQSAQAQTQLSTTTTALNAALNSQAMTLSTTAMSQQSQLQHAGLRAGQLATRASTNQTALTNTLANQNMSLSTTGMVLAQQLQHTNLRTGQLLTRQSTDATSLNNTTRNNEMTASTGLMSSTNQGHLANLRTAQGTTSQATTVFADAFRAQMARTQPDSANPIRWVINFPIRSLTDAWNNLDSQFALGKRVNPHVPNFRAGGLLRGPGTGTSDSILGVDDAGRATARVSTGEYVMPAARTRAHLPFLEALRSGQTEAVQAAGGRHARGPRRYAAGGVIAAQNFARQHHGKRYVWGGVGPGGFDCSGWLSAITNVLRGQAPYRRIGTTGTFPWAGFRSGLNSAFSIGAFKGSPGHMAGTLCIVGDMLIDGPHGPRRIDEIDVGDSVWSFDEGRRKPHRVVKAWFTKRQEVFEVRTSKGRSVTGSANHPFLVARKQQDRMWGPVELVEPQAEWNAPTGRQPYGAAGRDVCAVSTCARKMATHHLCRQHAARLVTHGDPRCSRALERQRWDVEWVRLDELVPGDLVVRATAAPDTGTKTELPDGRNVTEDVAWLIGHLVGDGSLVGRRGRIRVSCYRDEHRDRVLRAWKSLTGRDGRFRGYDSSSPPVDLHDVPTWDLFESMGMCVKGPEKRVPREVWRWPHQMQAAFLAGYCDADGTYPGADRPYVLRRYSSASEQLIADVRAMHIAHGDGVSNVGVREQGKGGFVGSKRSYSFDVYEGADDGGGIGDREGLRELVESWNGDYTLSRVQSVTSKGEQDTYDITVEGAHAFSVDGIQLHNSGTNVESGGSHRTSAIGGPAVGADNSQFNIRASLPQVGGVFAPGGAGGGAGFDPTPIVDAAFAKAYREIADVPKFHGPSPQVGRDQGVARFAADKVKAHAMTKLQEMFAAAGIGPLGAGAGFYVGEIARAAKAKGVGVDGATIGVATALVESGLKMYANRAVPASLRFPHDAVGSDHDSVGLFQQRQAGWGTLEQRMNAFGSAMLFFNKLTTFNWRQMDPGAAAQRVQVSAFPSRYSTRMGQARQLVGAHGGVFDRGGPLLPGWTMAFNGTGAAETILGPVESKNYEVLGRLMGRSGVSIDDINDGRGGSGGGALVGEYHTHLHGDDNERVAASRLVHRLRVVARAGGVT